MPSGAPLDRRYHRRFSERARRCRPVGIYVGVPIAILLMLCMLLDLRLMLGMLNLQFVTLSFAGALLHLVLVWIIDPAKWTFGTRIANASIGILSALRTASLLPTRACIHAASVVATLATTPVRNPLYSRGGRDRLFKDVVRLRPSTQEGRAFSLGRTRLRDVSRGEVQPWVTSLSASHGGSSLAQTYLVPAGILKYPVRNGP